MLCMGRPVDRHGNVQIRADIPKMDRKWVDQIPLVVYIPAKEEPDELDQVEGGLPEPTQHTYPPESTNQPDQALSTEPQVNPETVRQVLNGEPGTPPTDQPSDRRRRRGRFLFLRRKPSPPQSGRQADAEQSRMLGPAIHRIARERRP